jgi:aspartate ammonia-lyase
VLAEVAHQVPFGDRYDVTTTMAAEAGQHHLNAFEPSMRHFVSESTPTCAPPA